jgi:hypothetical protein
MEFEGFWGEYDLVKEMGQGILGAREKSVETRSNIAILVVATDIKPKRPSFLTYIAHSIDTCQPRNRSPQVGKYEGKTSTADRQSTTRRIFLAKHRDHSQPKRAAPFMQHRTALSCMYYV